MTDDTAESAYGYIFSMKRNSGVGLSFGVVVLAVAAFANVYDKTLVQ